MAKNEVNLEHSMEVTLHRFLVDFGTTLEARSGPKVVLKSEQKSDEKKKGPKAAQGRIMTRCDF